MKTGGRSAGTPNTITKELREVIIQILDKEYQKLPELLESMNPRSRAELIVKLTSFVIPRPLEVSISEDQIEQPLFGEWSFWGPFLFSDLGPSYWYQNPLTKPHKSPISNPNKNPKKLNYDRTKKSREETPKTWPLYAVQTSEVQIRPIWNCLFWKRANYEPSAEVSSRPLSLPYWVNDRDWPTLTEGLPEL